MEVARMNYYFTGILIILLTLLAFCVGPAYPRNEYLNSYPNECRTGENEKLRQQLELMKMCNKVNRNPTLKHNKNFDLLVSKCRGIVPVNMNEERPERKNLWKEEKKKYLEANPDAKTMDNTTLKMPPKDYILPLPKPKHE
jgi:hypothetical protein